MELPFAPETALERRIVADPAWRKGAFWGKPRPGHEEGEVVKHVADVLENIDAGGASGEERERLRLVALVHDIKKHEASGHRRVVNGHHGICARRFAARYVDDEDLLDLIEWHDDAYRAWRLGKRTGQWRAAERRARALIERLGDRLPLFLAFYRADNATGSKSDDDVRWFERVAADAAGAGAAGSARTRRSPAPPPRT